MKIKLLLFTSFVCTIYASAQLAPSEIFKKSTDKLVSGNMELRLDMKETKRNGKVSEKSTLVLMGKFGDQEKIKTTILKPERAKGITIVITQYPDKLGLIEILTPANGKIRKMKATEKNIGLVGSDALFSAYTSKKPSELGFERLPDETVGQKACYSIVVWEKDNANTGKAQFVIDKKTFHILQITSYDAEDVKEAFTELSDFNASGGKAYPGIIITENFKNKGKKEIRILSMVEKKGLKQDTFNLSKVGTD